MNNSIIEIYKTENGATEISVTLDHDTVWLNLFQLTELFQRDKSVISRHVSNIFKEKELDINSVVAKNATTAKEKTQNAKLDTRTEAKPSSPKANILDNIKNK